VINLVKYVFQMSMQMYMYTIGYMFTQSRCKTGYIMYIIIGQTLMAIINTVY